MKFLFLLISLLSFFILPSSTWALTENELNLRNTANISTTGNTNMVLEDFIGSNAISDFFFSPGGTG